MAFSEVLEDGVDDGEGETGPNQPPRRTINLDIKTTHQIRRQNMSKDMNDIHSS